MAEEGKTLTELANELGVSRDKIIYRYKKLPEEDYYKENNTIFLKTNGVQKIVDDLGDEIKSEVAKDDKEEPLNQSFDYLVEQLNIKDKQINQLQKLIDQQQQLNAEDKKLIKELHHYLAIEPPKDDDEEKESKNIDDELQQKDEKLAQLEEQLKTTENWQQEKEALEAELASIKQKNKKWYQFWK